MDMSDNPRLVILLSRAFRGSKVEMVAGILSERLREPDGTA